HDAQHLAHAAAERLAANRAPPQAEGDALEHGQMREQRVGLEDGVDVALVGRQPAHLALAEVDPSLRGLLEAANHPQGRRLAAAGGTEQCEKAAGLEDRKSTRLNSSHVSISYAVFCLKKKNKTKRT